MPAGRLALFTPLRLILAILAVLIAIAILFIAVLVFRPVTFAYVLETRIGAAVGGRVQIEDIQWVDGSDLSLLGVSVSVPGMIGPTAEVMHVDRMTVRWSGGPSDFRVDDVLVHEAVVRLMERAAWDLTLADLRPEVSEGLDGGVRSEGKRGEPSGAIPRVILESLRIESGELLGSEFVLNGHARFVGELTPLLDDSGGLSFKMQEVEGGSASLSGTYYPATDRLSATARGISLGVESQQLIPFWTIRESAAQLQLKGEVGEITIVRARGEPIRASMDLEDVSIQLDPTVLGIGDHFWELFLDGRILKHADPIPPRLFVESGFVEFSGDEFRISGLEGHIASSELWGESVKVPYRVDLLLAELADVAALDHVADMKAALARVPFMLDVTAHEVLFERGHVAVVPADAARILELFQVRQCGVDMDLSFDRSVNGGPIDVNGRLDLSNGRGAYDRFPYPLHDLDAVILLEDDEVKVAALTARGSGDSSVMITGHVEATRGKDLAVRIQAKDVPLDRVLIEAMPPRAEATLRDVFSWEHVDVPAGPGVAHQIVDLDLLVEQDSDENLSIGGVIPFDHLRMTWREFPLTMLLGEGQLRWDEDMHMEGPDGGPISVRTAEGGGIGSIRGAILIPLGDGQGGGWIEFDVEDERIDANLLRALLHVSDGATEVLSRGGLEGVLSATGRIEIDGDDIQYDVETSVRQGSLAVTPALEDLAGLSLAGPLGDAALLDLEGRVNVSNEGLVLAPLTVRASGAEVVLEGTPHDGGNLRVSATGLHIGRWLLGYFPESILDTVSDLWSVWGPWGRFDVVVQLDGEVLTPTSVDLGGLSMEIDPGQHVSLRDGTVRFAGGGAFFHAALLQISTEAIPATDIELRGSLMPDGEDAKLLIDTDTLMLSLPLLRDVIMLTAGHDGDRAWRVLQPSGETALSARMETLNGSSSWQVDLQPRSVQAMWEGRTLAFSDSGGSSISLRPGMALLERVSGNVGEAAIDLAGQVEFEPLSIEIGGKYAGGLGDELLLAFAGPQWESVLAKIELDDGGHARIDPLNVSLKKLGDQWDGLVDGRVLLDGASLSVGVKLEDVHASVDTDITIASDHASIDLRVARASATVHGATLRGISGTIKSDPTEDAPSRVRIGPLAGELGSGRLVVDGEAGGADDSWSANVSLANARLSRLFPQSGEADNPPSTGEVDASLHLRGRSGDGDATAGVGTFRVMRGYLRTLPAVVALQQVLQLSSPVVGAISFVDVEFHIHGGEAILEHIVLASGATGGGGFSLRGEGVLDLNTMSVQARLRPRGAWPIVRDVIGALQDQFYEISMEGHVGDPAVGVVPLPGLSRGGLLGGGGNRE
jgi:hypothetical protein